jgi:transcriptional regulator NrdR family protein
MVCIQCGNKTSVINSRLQHRNNNVWRRRKCLSCNLIFTTLERANLESSWIVMNKSGGHAPFLEDKLLISIYLSCLHRETALTDARQLTDTVIKKLKTKTLNSRLDSKTIAQTAIVALNRFDSVSSSYYAARHSI